MNTHDPDANLHVTTSNATYSGTKSYNRTESNLNLEGVKSVKVNQVKGKSGCYSLFQLRNFQLHLVTINSGDREVSSEDLGTEIRSIEYFPDCSSNNYNNYNSNNRIYLGGALGVSAVIMIVVLLPTLKKETYKLKTKATKISETQMAMMQCAMEAKNSTDRTNTEINYTILWSEIVNWRANIQTKEARKAILLGLLPSVFDVFSDYSYARTWNDQDGFCPQIRALIFFFICLPHVVAFVTAAKMGIFRIFTCSGSNLCLRILAKTAATFLFLSVLGGLIFGSHYLWWNHPGVFAYPASVSAVITVGLKAACVAVQGPETKKAMTLTNARKVHSLSFRPNNIEMHSGNKEIFSQGGPVRVNLPDCHHLLCPPMDSSRRFQTGRQGVEDWGGHRLPLQLLLHHQQGWHREPSHLRGGEQDGQCLTLRAVEDDRKVQPGLRSHHLLPCRLSLLHNHGSRGWQLWLWRRQYRLLWCCLFRSSRPCRSTCRPGVRQNLPLPTQTVPI